VILITTPTGRIGSQVLIRLLERDDAVRVIVRDPARLDAGIRRRVQVVVGSHDDPAVLDESMRGVDGLLWLVPPSVVAASAEEHYLGFARPAAEAIRRHCVAHVVAVSSAGHAWPARAGLLSAAFAMDAEITRTGAAYRALSPPFFMENLLGQVGAIREHGVFSLANAADRPLATVAIRDVADIAAPLLADRSWSGQQNLPVFGPDRLTPNEMADVISGALDRTVSFRQLTLADVASALAGRGASAGVVRDVIEMIAAVDAGVYDADQEAAYSGSTDFRTWCRDVLRPAVLA
jgi:uncharacterized protein YbjT (DUF2867 family)